MKRSGNEKCHTEEAITVVILLWAVPCQPQRVVEQKGGMEEAGGKTFRMGREGTTWSGLMIGLWTNLSYRDPREVNEKALIVVSKVRISQRPDPQLYVVQSIGHSLTRGAPTKHGPGVIFAFKIFDMSPWLLRPVLLSYVWPLPKALQRVPCRGH